jgi:pilus assembly protein CpaE
MNAPSPKPFSSLLSMTGLAKPRRSETDRNVPRVLLYADREDLNFDPDAINIPAQISVRRADQWREGGAIKGETIIVRVPDGPDLAADMVSKLGGVPVIALVTRAEPAMVEALFRAGAADVLSVPLSADALSLALHRINATRSQEPRTQRRGRIVGILGASGGVGTSTLLVNLATHMSARARVSGGVRIIDLDVQGGVCATLLDLNAGASVTDILSSGGQEDVDVVREAFTTHSSGLSVMMAPAEITPLEAINADAVAKLIAAAAVGSELILIDLPNAWTAWTDAVLRTCDTIILVGAADVVGVHQTRRHLTMLAAQSLDTIPLMLVAGRAKTGWNGSASMKECARSLRRDYDVVIPADDDLARAAADQGKPIALLRKGSKLDKAYHELAEALVRTLKRGV